LRAFYGSPISEHLARLADGSLLARSVVLCRTGFQEYLPGEIADTLPPNVQVKNGRVRVYRPASEVLAPRTLASLEGVTVTKNHPPVFLSPATWQTWTCGHAQNIREGPTLPEGRTVIGDLVIKDRGLGDSVESGELREVSVGYDCIYATDDTGQLCQTNIIANHVAVLRAGRMNVPAAICDRAIEATFARLGRLCQRDPGLAAIAVQTCDELLAELSELDAVTAAADYAAECRRFHRRPM
jgi:hypothetical protein